MSCTLKLIPVGPNEPENSVRWANGMWNVYFGNTWVAGTSDKNRANLWADNGSVVWPND